MLCRKPYSGAHGVFGCGQCLPCRLNRRRLWTHRILLEQLKHDTSSFITLTYDQDHYPSDGSLRPVDAQLWLKRLRKAIYPRTLRYFLVGEYGEQTWRPHYHLAAFGVGDADRSIVQSTWGHGFIQLGDLNLHSAQYIAGYVTKKLTSSNDPRLKGRFQEFARMSLRPGIGATAVDDIIFSLIKFSTSIPLDDVPNQLRHGSKLMPLGRYIRRKLREGLSLSPETPPHIQERFREEMRVMLSDFLSASPQGKNFTQWLSSLDDGKAATIQARSVLYSGRSL